MMIVHVVTLVDDRASYGGPLTVALGQCAQLRALGHDARLVAGWRGEGSPPREVEGVPAHLFPLHQVVPGSRFSGLLSFALLRWLRAHTAEIDVAHVHAARDLVPLLAAQVFRRGGVPYLTQTHGMIAPDPRRSARVVDLLLTRRLLGAAASRLVLTTREEDDLAAVLRRPGTTDRLPNGVSVPSSARALEASPLDVLFLARLHPRKRVMDFARAARDLLAEGVDAVFTVVGPDDGDGDELGRFVHETRSDRLRYAGALPHAEAVERLAGASVFVLPSVDEPFPMSLLEALARGVPSVCTTGCGIAGELRRAGAALVVEPGHAGLTTALRTLLADESLRRDLSERGVETVRREYSLASVVSVLASRYESARGVRQPASTRTPEYGD